MPDHSDSHPRNCYNLILERDQLYTERDQLHNKYNHLIMERDQLEAHLILQWDQLYAQYNHLIVERDLLQREVNQLKRDRAGERGIKHLMYPH